MSKEMVVTPQEVKDALIKNGPITKKNLADMFGCTVPTIESRLRQLRDDGETILHNTEGSQIVDGADAENVDLIRCNEMWIIGGIRSLAQYGSNIRPLLLEARKVLSLGLSKKERQVLKSHLMQFNRLIEAVEIDEELGV